MRIGLVGILAGVLLGEVCSLVGCFGAESVLCTSTDGDWYCPPSMICHATSRCVNPDQVAACGGLGEGEPCTHAGGSGICIDGACVTTVGCGNDLVEPPESCDGNNLSGLTCADFEYYSGTLACQPDCSDFDMGGCDEHCGDGVINGPETCDGSNFGDDSCLARGYYTGSLTCDATCQTNDFACSEHCGDGICDPVNGEDHASCPGDCHGYASVSAGGAHSCAVAPDETAWCWGANGSGQLGNTTTSASATPVPVTGLAGAVAISAGGSHSCAVAPDGTAWCWGTGDNGRLGNGITSGSATPVQVTGLTSAVAISAGGGHSCAAGSDGRAWCWGSGSEGQLGNGSSSDRNTPVLVVGLPNAVAISAGSYHSCAVASDGTAWCWGTNGFGQLGNSGIMDSETAAQVVGLTDIMAISAGQYHSCAVASDGTTWCWGRGIEGQVGNGVRAQWNTPQLTNLAGVVAISTNRNNSCAVTLDDTVWCWGQNDGGQLGDGLLSHQDCLGTPGWQDCSSIPVQVSELGSAVTISAGSRHSCATLSDGTAWCWGLGDSGRLGNGTTVDSSVPVQVLDPP